MKSPDHQNEMPPLPPAVNIVEVSNQLRSPSDTVSQLSQPSTSLVAAISSPLGAKDVGQPMTPEGRLIKPIDETAIDQGYDSDGLRAPWEGAEEVSLDDPELEESPLPFGSSASLPREPSPENVAEKSITMDEVMKMKVPELREELKKRGLSTKGNKAAYVDRMKDAIEKGLPLLENLTTEKVNNLAGDSFSPGAHWEPLVCEGEYINETLPNHFRYPTVPEGERSSVKKRNFNQKFDRMVFDGIAEIPRRYRDGRIAKNRDGEVQFEKQHYVRSTVDMDFIRANKLDLHSHPAKWFEAFVPIKDGGNQQHFSMEKVLSWTNMRAWVDNASLGGKYKDFTNFTLDELMKHIGLYLFQGLSPSPQVEMKFHSQSDDPVNGNDFIHSSFGGNTTRSKRRHRHFKSFFSSVDPRIPPPSRTTHPNWKVHPLLKHLPQVSQKALFLGRNLSCDEQTIGFQGHHKDKQRITYKKEGDGFLADCICSDGYTYAFHFRHQQASIKLMETFNCSPLHARVLGLISQLPNKYYTLGMDNLYMSAKFCRLAYSMEQKVMVHGVTRPSLRGIPPAIKQDEVKKKKELASVRHTVKAAVLKGDEVCKDLVSISLYDTKPVYFLTNACGELNWVMKEKKVYDAVKKKTVKLPFYRLNVVDFYNNNMGNVDLADQLRNHYRYDTSWHRNRKWWWSIWWWGFQVLLTNSYILYTKYHKLLDSKQALTHYDFIKEISLAWINKEMYFPKVRNVAASRKRKTKDDATKDDGKRVTRGAAKKLDIDATSVFSNSSICIEITDNSLHPTSGKLSCRLNTAVQHLPEQKKGKRLRCALHRWSRDRQPPEVFAGVILCSVCRVHLCINCYNLFHKEAYLVGKKEAIAAS